MSAQIQQQPLSSPPPPPPMCAEWYGKQPVEMLPFLSLCSRYSAGPTWAGLLQQTIKEKQKLGSGESIDSFTYG